jgi:hypothetical protein
VQRAITLELTVPILVSEPCASVRRVVVPLAYRTLLGLVELAESLVRGI